MITRPMHDQNGRVHPCDLPAQDLNDIHYLVDGDKRHAPVGIVRAIRHIRQLAARLRHIAINARLTRRQMLEPLLRRDHDGSAEANDMSNFHLN